MRQLGRIFTKPKGEERRFFHNHVGGGDETDGDGRRGWKRGSRDGGRRRECDCVIMTNSGDAVGLEEGGTRQAGGGKKVEEGGADGKGHRQKAEGQDHNHLIVLVEEEDWSESPSRS